MDRNRFRMRGRSTVIAAAVMVSLAGAPVATTAFAQAVASGTAAAAGSGFR